jgi:1,2-diacylglycerol 3-alpha-glucosyltransferase
MNIAFAYEIFLPQVNGILTSTFNLAKNLIDSGHKVVFIAPAWEKSTEVLVDGKIPVYYLPSIKTWIYEGFRLCAPRSKKLRKFLQDEKIDVLHLTAPWMVNMVAMYEARKLGIAILHTYHTMLTEAKYVKMMTKFDCLIPAIRPLGWQWVKYFLKRSHIITAPTCHVQQFLKNQLPHHDIRVMSNGVDLKALACCDSLKQLLEKYPQFDPRHTLLFIGRLSHEKQVDVLIRAMRLVKDRRIRLFVVGGGHLEKKLQELTAELGLENRIFFLGNLFHDRLLRSGLIHYSRILVTASTTETQGMTMIEAACCGVPVIAADVPVNREIALGRGLLFKPNDSVDLAHCIERLMTDELLYERCKEKLVDLQSKFDGRRIAEQTMQVYEEAMQKIRA